MPIQSLPPGWAGQGTSIQPFAIPNEGNKVLLKDFDLLPLCREVGADFDQVFFTFPLSTREQTWKLKLNWDPRYVDVSVSWDFYSPSGDGVQVLQETFSGRPQRYFGITPFFDEWKDLKKLELSLERL